MSAHRVVVLTCDHDVSGPCHVRRTTPYATKAKAREDGARYGWKSRGDWDMCPDHSFPGPIYDVTGGAEPCPERNPDPADDVQCWLLAGHEGEHIVDGGTYRWGSPGSDERDEQRRAALVPLDVLEERFGISRRTLFYWLKIDEIETHGNGTKARAVKWGDVEDASKHSTRWPGA